jgi:hypothetical protein
MAVKFLNDWELNFTRKENLLNRTLPNVGNENDKSKN